MAFPLPDFEPALEILARHRGWLVAGYLLAVAMCIAGVFIFGIAIFGEAVHYATSPEDVEPVDSAVGLWTTMMWIVGWVVLQAVFLWGGGRIQLAGEPVRGRRIAVSLVIMAALMVVLTATMLLPLAEMVDRFLSAEPARRIDLSRALTSWPGLVAAMVSWVLWLVLGWQAVRGTDHVTALSRLIGVLLAGSWIEFSVALPIELATRPRTKECPCASGSWLTLVICIPLLLWAVGPALYLLYRRERHLTEGNRRHALKILLRKSIPGRSPSAPPS